MKRWSLSALMLCLGLGVGGTLVGPWLHGQNTPLPTKPLVVPGEISSYRDVVKHILPAVVSIETRAKPKIAAATNGTPSPSDFPPIPEEFRRFFEEFRQAPLQPNEPNRVGFGSGFIIDAAGIVVTNYHVLEGADSAIVNLHDGRKFHSKNIRLDRRTDLAVIVLDANHAHFPFLEFGDSDAMEIGDRVLAVGAPFGLAGSVTHGIISAKGRNGMHMNMYEDFLQTDAPINPGNSGGPLVNLEGKVIGINAAIKSRSGGFQGVGLAVASNLAKNVVQSLRTTGVVQRGYLGVQVRELDAEVAARLGVPRDTGVVIGEVFEKTPAAKAGMKAGDIVTRIDGKKIKDGIALQGIVAALSINKTSPVEIFRDNKTLNLTVTIEEQPSEYGTAGVPAPRNRSNPTTRSATLEALGLDIAELTVEHAQDLGYRKDVQGVVITGIQENGIAAESTLRRGMVITKIDQRPVTSIVTARQAMQSANLSRGVVLQITTPQGGVNYVLLRSSRSTS